MRKIITYGGYFEAFMSSLSLKEQQKVDYVVSLLATNDRMPTKFIKHLKDELYELTHIAAVQTLFVKDCYEKLVFWGKSLRFLPQIS